MGFLDYTGLNRFFNNLKTILSKKITGVGVSEIRKLTQEEYEQLSDDQKSNGTIYVTDKEIKVPDTAYQTAVEGGYPGTEQEFKRFLAGELSSDEMIIGRYVDGRPLYRKTYTGRIINEYDSSSDYIYIIEENLNSDIVVIQATGQISNGSLIAILPYNDYKQQLEVYIAFDASTEGYGIYISDQLYSRSFQYVVTLTYIKASDME